ncbi:hypothetical protein FQN60_006864, partial [Etheostoma spectabile]
MLIFRQDAMHRQRSSKQCPAEVSTRLRFAVGFPVKFLRLLASPNSICFCRGNHRGHEGYERAAASSLQRLHLTTHGSGDIQHSGAH